jgi:hypothetical protein
MSVNYPSLHEMGIQNPEDISRYSLQNVNDVDILRVVYKRQKGSLLPHSKKFRFARSRRMVVADSGTNSTEILSEISPFLNKVIDELHQVVELKHTHQEHKAIILDEINRLEEEVHTRMTYIKSLVDKLD